jgi:hypothetical protein
MKELEAVKIVSREERNKQIGTRHRRKLKKYSNNFNKMFSFFLKVNRSGLITFCGSIIEVEFDPNEISGKECFRLYEDGYYKGGKPIVTKHPNLVKSVLIGKKGWGLWSNMWSEGISEGSFIYDEIMYEFVLSGINIPTPLLKDFENKIKKLILKRIKSID